jgi:fucokinase
MWDYLILTASNDRQAASYEGQLELRRRAGLLPDVRIAMVVADPQGKRVGSGGSTLYCLMRVVEAEAQRTGHAANDLAAVERLLKGLRVLILHAGGDSRRVPAYGPCGKIFSPVPGKPCGGVISTLFDRLYPIFRDMPRGAEGAGQVIVAAGDALPLFDSSAVRFDRPGVTALGAYETPEAASKHGVFCVAANGETRLFLQKPSVEEQRRLGAIDGEGRAVLDIGIMSFDAAAVTALFQAFDIELDGGAPRFPKEIETLVLDRGLDLYREICCALGSEATAEHHRTSSHSSGSTWSAGQLAKIHCVLSDVPFSTVVLPKCDFLHFGTTRQLITSGLELFTHGRSEALSKLKVPVEGLVDEMRLLVDPFFPFENETELGLNINNRISELSVNGIGVGVQCWIEGCRIDATLKLAGQNVVVGVDVDEPLQLPRGACLDIIEGQTCRGTKAWFVRTYHLDDTFKDTLAHGGTLCGRPLDEWLAAVGAAADDVWPEEIAVHERSLWNARVFPAVQSPQGYRDWLWTFDSSTATAEQKRAFLEADRYSVAEIALLADIEAFYARRSKLCDTP